MPSADRLKRPTTVKLNERRTELQRTKREGDYMKQNDSNSQVSPDPEPRDAVLHDVMDELPNEDRDILVQRYFQNQKLRIIGNALGISDDAAQPGKPEWPVFREARIARRG
jgi:DNA-directed RNA polymerase specialized sigma subunit